MFTFIETASAHRLYPAWRLTIAGLCRSEVLGLRWCDLGLNDKTVTVAQARVMLNDRETYLKAPKTERGRRTLPLDDEILRAVESYKIRLLEESFTFGDGYARDHDLVVVDEAGVPLRPELYGDEFRRLSKTAGVPPIRLHDPPAQLRHASAPRGFAHGVGERLARARVRRVHPPHLHPRPTPRHAGCPGPARCGPSRARCRGTRRHRVARRPRESRTFSSGRQTNVLVGRPPEELADDAEPRVGRYR